MTTGLLRRIDDLSTAQCLVFGLPLGLALGFAVPVLFSTVWAPVVFGVLLLGLARLGTTGVVRLVDLPLDDEDPSDTESPSEAVGLREPPHPVTPRDLWVDVPAGTFMMGSPEHEEGRRDDEGPVHKVSVSGFRMMKVTVTENLYRQVIGEGDSESQLPKTRVSWFDAVRFCNRLSEAEGLEPCYAFDAEDQVRWLHEADGYRLPTEAEWEWACRGDLNTNRFCFGDDESELTDYAWYGEGLGAEVHQVGEKRANSFGLFDIHGNVWEWCWDWYGAYSNQAQEDPVGPEEGDLRILRGGSAWDVPRDLRSAYRYWYRPEFRVVNWGFRCVRGLRGSP